MCGRVRSQEKPTDVDVEFFAFALVAIAERFCILRDAVRKVSVGGFRGILGPTTDEAACSSPQCAVVRPKSVSSGRRTKRSRDPITWRVVVTRDVFSSHRGKRIPRFFFSLSLENPSSLGSVISSKTRVTRKRRPHSFTDDYNNNGDHERRDGWLVEGRANEEKKVKNKTHLGSRDQTRQTTCLAVATAAAAAFPPPPGNPRNWRRHTSPSATGQNIKVPTKYFRRS